MPVRENLPFTKQRDGRNWRCQDDSVINEVPEAEDALQVRLFAGSGLSRAV
jgi:hypothetical protein